MAWCQNEDCMKDGLRKEDIEFDETTRKILCHGCMTLVHPGWKPPLEFVDLTGIIPTVVRNSIEPRFGMALQVSENEGVKAAFSYGGLSLTIHVPNEDYKKMFGG